jgi:CHAT domain-containing protein
MRHLLASLPLLLALTVSALPARALDTAPAVDSTAPWYRQMQAEQAAMARAAQAGQGDAALQHLTLALAAAEQGAGPSHPLVANLLGTLGEVHAALGHLPQAEAAWLRALPIAERFTGPASIQVAWLAFRIGATRLQLGRPAEAVPLLERALAIHDALPNVGLNERLNLLGTLMEATTKLQVDGARAIALGQRRLELAAGVADPGERAWYLTKIHADLATAHLANADWEGAAQAIERGLVAAATVPEGDRAPGLFRLLELRCGLASIRDPEHAEAQCRQALVTGEGAFGLQDARLARVCLTLGTLVQRRGALAEARPWLERAVALLEHQPDPLQLAQPLQQLAGLLDELGQDAQAEALYRRTTAIFEQALGPDHAGTANGKRILARFFHARGRDTEALPLLVAAEASVRKLHGPEHVLTAELQSDLGELQSALGEHAVGLGLVQHALAVMTRRFGGKSGLLTTHLARLGRIELALGHVREAVAATEQVEELREKRVAGLLLTGSEEQKRQFLETLRETTDATLSLNLQHAPQDPRASHLALQTLLRRKGRLLDALAGSIGTLRTRLGPGEATLLDQLTAAQARLTEPPKDPAQLQAWQATQGPREAEVEALQQKVSEQSAALRETVVPVTVEQVQALVPEGAALVEYAQYQPFVATQHGAMTGLAAPRYAAWVLRRHGEVKAVDLGLAAPIDAQVEQVRAALANPGRADAGDLSRALDEKILRPVRGLLGDARQLLVAPDGQLNLVPFAALRDEAGRWAVETRTVSYLSAGRDLVRLQQRLAPKGPAVVVANPAFDQQVVGKAVAQGRRSADAGTLTFAPLPGAEAEGRKVAPLLPGARLLVGPGAGEAVLKGLHAPVVLHLATHGFFLPDTAGHENPLLRSGLALAGANQKTDGAEDGLLSALEAAGLDLWGTELVVLSACETGVGRVHTGEGVYGLRRALGLAGARTQVMSLWKVDDEGTRDLMVDLYRRLGQGEGRAEALRQAQLAMIAGAGHGSAKASDRGAQALGEDSVPKNDLGRAHPYYWAAFIAAGDWGPMRLHK